MIKNWRQNHSGTNFTLHKKVVRKTSDETIDTSTAMQNDDELLLAVIANEVWQFEMLLNYDSAANADIKFGWSVPSGTTMEWNDLTNWDGSAPLTQTGTKTHGTSGVGTNNGVIYKGLIIVGSTAGNVNLQWAQDVSQGTNTTVFTNSCLIATRLT